MSRNFEKKIEPKWVITLLAKRQIPPKVNTWIDTFLLSALGFYLNLVLRPKGTQCYRTFVNGDHVVA